MQPFDFDLEESGFLDYRFRGSYIFDTEGTPLMVQWIEDGIMCCTNFEGDDIRFTNDDKELLVYGVPEHGWTVVSDNTPTYLNAAFPSRKWKYGYQPEVDSGCYIDQKAIEALVAPILATDHAAFLRGDGVFSRKIAAQGGQLYCHQKLIGYVEDGVIRVSPKYDFITYEFPSNFEVVVDDNI